MKELDGFLYKFIEEVRANKNSIRRILKYNYLVNLNHLEVFEDSEVDLFFITIWGYLESYRNKIKSERKEELDEYDLFKRDLDFSFYEVDGYSDNRDYIRLRNLRDESVELYNISPTDNLKEGNLIYGLTYGEPLVDRSYLYSNHIELDRVEKMMVTENYRGGSKEEAFRVILEQLTVSRMVKSFLAEIEDIMRRYHKSLFNEFGEDVIYEFFKHLSDTSRFALTRNKGFSIYDIDYFEFLKYATTKGYFVVEGDLELFIDILEHILSREAKRDPSKEKTYENILKAKENIFLLRENLSKHYPVTSLQLINGIEMELDDRDIDVLSFYALGFHIETLFRLDDIITTPKTRKLTMDTVRYALAETSLNEEGEEAFEEEKEILQLALAIILGNGLGRINFVNRLVVLTRMNYFISSSNSELFANVLTALFRKETFENYFNYKDVDYEELVEVTLGFLKTLDDSELRSMKPGEKMIYLLEILGFVIDLGYRDYELGTMGKFVNKYLYKDDQKARVLKLDEFKK